MEKQRPNCTLSREITLNIKTNRSESKEQAMESYAMYTEA